MKEKVNKKNKKFSQIAVSTILLCGIVYLSFSFVMTQMDIAQKQKQLDEISAQLNSQMQENTELERIIGSDNEEEYMERIARDKLGYASPDERIFIDAAGK